MVWTVLFWLTGLPTRNTNTSVIALAISQRVTAISLQVSPLGILVSGCALKWLWAHGSQWLGWWLTWQWNWVQIQKIGEDANMSDCVQVSLSVSTLATHCPDSQKASMSTVWTRTLWYCSTHTQRTHHRQSVPKNKASSLESWAAETI